MIWLIRSTVFIDFAFVNLIFRFHLIFRDNAIQRKFVIQFFFNWNGKIRCFSSPVQHWTIYRYVSSTAWDLADTVNCIKKNSGFWTWAFIGRMIAKIKSVFFLAVQNCWLWNRLSQVSSQDGDTFEKGYWSLEAELLFADVILWKVLTILSGQLRWRNIWKSVVLYP